MTRIWKTALRSTGGTSDAGHTTLVAACLLAIGLLALLVLPGAAGAAVRTDQPSYAPGSVVTISGDNSDSAGYASGETVNVAVSHSGQTTSCSATADGSGAWSCQITLASDSSAVGEYSYTATGQASGVSQSGTFTDAGCPNSSSLGSHTNEDPKLQASYTSSGGEAKYSITTTNESPSGGIPGLIEYCVYTSPLPDETEATYSNSHGAWDSGTSASGGYFDFGRSDGNPDNLPFDGTTQAVGNATWESGKVPSTQVILLHINDEAECTALEGKKTETCFVRPGKGTQAASPPTAEKTAEPAFTRTFKWKIEKSVDKTQVTTSGPATFKYTVTVTHDNGKDSGWEVTGKISVTNSNSAAITGVNVTDAINDTHASCSVTGGTNATIPANSTEEFAYTCTYSAAPESSSETNTATIKWPTQTLSNGSSLTAGSTTATAAVDWSSATPTIVDGSVEVTDTLGGTLGTVHYTDPSPTTFTYEHTFTGDPPGKCTTHENTATSETDTTKTKASASQTVEVCVPEACHTLFGVGHFGPRGSGGINLNDNMGTCPQKQVFEMTWENGTEHMHMTKLTSASYSKNGAEQSFSGTGEATVNKTSGYQIKFTFTLKGGRWYLTLVIEKGGKVFQEFKLEPLNSGTKENIS